MKKYIFLDSSLWKKPVQTYDKLAQMKTWTPPLAVGGYSAVEPGGRAKGGDTILHFSYVS